MNDDHTEARVGETGNPPPALSDLTDWLAAHILFTTVIAGVAVALVVNCVAPVLSSRRHHRQPELRKTASPPGGRASTSAPQVLRDSPWENPVLLPNRGGTLQ